MKSAKALPMTENSDHPVRLLQPEPMETKLENRSMEKGISWSWPLDCLARSGVVMQSLCVMCFSQDRPPAVRSVKSLTEIDRGLNVCFRRHLATVVPSLMT